MPIKAVHRVYYESTSPYDVVVAALGYERRSTYLLRQGTTAPHVLTIAFDAGHNQVYEDNERVARSCSEVVEASDATYGAILQEFLLDRRPSRLAIDISSLSRYRLAEAVARLEEIALTTECDWVVDFFYAPAEYRPPREMRRDHEETSLHAGPVHPRFAGSIRSVSIPVCAVFGLGYEESRALGVFELLEPKDVWLFKPLGFDERYEQAVNGVNSYLLTLMEPRRILTYRLDEPASTYSALESLVYSIGRVSRLVMVPMGPKIFALNCLLLGLSEDISRPAVWRVGPRSPTSFADSVEAGPLFGLSVVFSGSASGRASSGVAPL